MTWKTEPWAGIRREVSGDYWVYEDGYGSEDEYDWPYACAYYKDDCLSGHNIFWNDVRCVNGKDMSDVAKEICEEHFRHGQEHP